MTEQTKCPISEVSMESVFEETILQKYKVTYYFCKECGLLKTEKPFWLSEAYSEAIGDTDTGVLMRNIVNSDWLEVLLKSLFIEKGKFLDVAGGYGLLTRLMRDKGFDCYTTDKFCQNLFAKTFEPDTYFKADALFAFEVFEHIDNPLEFLHTLFEKYSCKTIIFSTKTFSDTIPSRDWWYYSFEDGRHITFYQPKTLSRLAERLGCKFYMINPDLHIITDKQLSAFSRLLIFNKHIWRLYSFYIRRKRKGLSKMLDDHLVMQKRFNKG